LSFILVGNKNDDPQRKVVLTEDAQRFAEQMNIQLFETSAKDNLNVEDMFIAITEKVLRHKKQTQRQQNESEDGKIRIDRNTSGSKKSRKKCC
jgi:Ras-related protein Rab-35